MFHQSDADVELKSDGVRLWEIQFLSPDEKRTPRLAQMEERAAQTPTSDQMSLTYLAPTHAAPQ